jgi:integrase/recombinase XerD
MAGEPAMTDFSTVVADYLITRRAMGYKLAYQGQMLEQFAAYLHTAGAEHVTIAHALSWAKQPADAAPVWWSVRLSTVRPEPSHRAVPYIYSDDDIVRLREAAGRLHPEHRADTYQTLIALIAVTGMRVGESVRLDRADIDLDQGMLTIRTTKFGKSRQNPLHATTVDALAAYADRRDDRRRKPKSVSFFTSAIGTRLLRDNVSTVFPRLVREAGIQSPARYHSPRMHDLRHTFAVRTLIGWYRDGVNVEQRLPLLSTWLGHATPRDTYWYLSAVPELLGLVADRIDAATTEVLP